MSMISELLDKLRKYAAEYNLPPFGREVKGTAELLNEAANTIETLSAKLSAANMERSERYYGGRWILCKDRTPENKEDDSPQYLITVKVGENEYEIDFGWWSKISKYDYLKKGWDDYFGWIVGNDWDEGQGMEVIAWMPLPQPYKPDKE